MADFGAVQGPGLAKVVLAVPWGQVQPPCAIISIPCPFSASLLGTRTLQDVCLRRCLCSEFLC